MEVLIYTSLFQECMTLSLFKERASEFNYRHYGLAYNNNFFILRYD